METMNQALIPGLPDEVSLRILAKISHGYHGVLECVCKRWKNAVRSSDYANFKAREGWSGDWLIVLPEDQTGWIAYDPDANRWHPLPRIPRAYSDYKHNGFECVSADKKFLVIGGRYVSNDLRLDENIVTNEVMQFDPCKKQWSRVASMRTARCDFACAVVCGKVYVAGGWNSSSESLADAEVYNPSEDRWEDLPPLSIPGRDHCGTSYEDRFYVLPGKRELTQLKPFVFEPSSRIWRTVEEVIPFAWQALVETCSVEFSVIVLDNCLYVIDTYNDTIRTKAKDQGEWHRLGSIPPVVLPNHSRQLKAFRYSSIGLGKDLYVIGGKVLKYYDCGDKRYDIVKLKLVRVCDPTVAPLMWRETRPMCEFGGMVLGCASLEE